MSEPSSRLPLRQHHAPPGLIEAALRARPAPSRWPQALAAVALFAVGVAVGQGAGAPEAPAPQAALPAPRLVPVRLVLHAPTAERVAVAGSWNDWDPAVSPLAPIGGGLFALTLALPSGRHSYMFVIDGETWVTDPSAPLSEDDGFGQQNAVINI
jgi:hypothetical protein